MKLAKKFFLQYMCHVVFLRVSEVLAESVGVAFMQRPASGNISVTASLGSLNMSGRGQKGRKSPTIVQTHQQKTGKISH